MSGRPELAAYPCSPPFKLPDLTSKQYGLYVALASVPVVAACCVIASRHLPPPGVFLLFLVVALTISFFPVPISAVGVFLSPVLPVSMAMLYRGGPLPAVGIAVAAVILQVLFLNRRQLLKCRRAVFWGILHNGCQQIVAVGSVGVIYQTFIDAHLFRRESVISGLFLSALTLAAFYLNAVFVTTVASKAHGVRWDIVWYENYRWTFRGAVLMAPLGFISGALSVQSPWLGIAMIVFPLVAAQRGYQLHVRKLDIYRQSVDLLGRLMQEAHPYTQGHLYRVSTWARKIAVRMGLNAQSMTMIEDAAILHDIGKVAMDDRVLNKTGRLSDQDWTAIKEHPVIGSEILAKMRYFGPAAQWIRHHHERFDGMGYPNGLAGDAIPIESRIIAVVDAFDAMVGGPSLDSQRPYRRAMSGEAACRELLRCSGTQFDPEIVRAFIAVLSEEGHLISAKLDPEASDLLSAA